jgi:hypothetical protein
VGFQSLGGCYDTAPSLISKRWWKYAEIYRIFGGGDLDYSDESAFEAYQYETTGKGRHQLGLFGDGLNGYVIGKHWMNVQVKLWREGIKEGTLFIEELYDEGRYPHWWLEQHFPGTLESYREYCQLRDRYHGLIRQRV